MVALISLYQQLKFTNTKKGVKKYRKENEDKGKKEGREGKVIERRKKKERGKKKAREQKGEDTRKLRESGTEGV